MRHRRRWHARRRRRVARLMGRWRCVAVMLADAAQLVRGHRAVFIRFTGHIDTIMVNATVTV